MNQNEQEPTVHELTAIVLRNASFVFDRCLTKITHCVEQLNEAQLWWRPTDEMNSVGNLIVHLSGNVRQWVVAGIGDAQDSRNRPGEFSATLRIERQLLLDDLIEAVREAQAVLAGCQATDLASTRRIQGCDVSGWEAIFNSIPHFEGHTQEIIALTRQQLGAAYRFYWEPKTPEEVSAATDDEN